MRMCTRKSSIIQDPVPSQVINVGVDFVTILYMYVRIIESDVEDTSEIRTSL